MRNTPTLLNLVLAVTCMMLLAPWAVNAAETPAAPAVPAAPAATGAETSAGGESADEVRKHHANGEVKYAGKWMPIMELFETYRKALAEAKAVAVKGEGGKDRLTELNKTLAQILADWRKEKQPTDNERNAALAKKHLAEKYLTLRPPVPPQLQREPSASHGGGGWGGGGGGYRDNQNEIDRVRRENQRKQEQYQRDLARYNEVQRQSKAAIEQANATIAACDKKLEELATARKAKEKPFLIERTKLNEQLRAGPLEAASRTNLADDQEEALRAAPLTLRVSKGIIEWQGNFYLLSDLEEMYNKVKTEIDEARREAEAKARVGGKESPKDWRHPKHQEAESLNQTIAHAKALAPTPTK